MNTSELTHNLTHIAATWLDPASPLRQQALADAAPEFCLSPTHFAFVLDWIFSQWTEAKISEVVAQQPFKNSRYIVQVLAGTTPAMIAQGFFQGSLLNRPQCLKIPHQQPTFARLLHQSFAETSLVLSALFELNTGQENLPRLYSRLAQADLVFAYGQDQTIAALQKHLAPDTTFIAHGQAESAAILFKEAAQPTTLEKLAYDFLSYDQRGCLSPRVVFVEQGGKLDRRACTQWFAEKVLPPLAQCLPRGGLFPGEAAEILHQRNLYRFRGPVYCGKDWTVCDDETSHWPTTALPRFIPFQSFATPAELMTLLRPVQKRLMSLGYAGTPAQLAFLKQNFTARLCPVGTMQKQLLLF